jgi:hypothetical protein
MIVMVYLAKYWGFAWGNVMPKDIMTSNNML